MKYTGYLQSILKIALALRDVRNQIKTKFMIGLIRVIKFYLLKFWTSFPKRIKILSVN
jgi:hypothetical protein